MDDGRAAVVLQAAARGRASRAADWEKKNERARREWLAYYLEVGDLQGARRMHWDGSEPALPPGVVLYAAVDEEGTLHQGRLEAPDAAAARQMLAAQELRALDIAANPLGAAPAAWWRCCLPK